MSSNGSGVSVTVLEEIGSQRVLGRLLDRFEAGNLVASSPGIDRKDIFCDLRFISGVNDLKYIKSR